MAANIRLSALHNPAVLLSKEVTIPNDTCVMIKFFCYRCTNNDLVFTLSINNGGYVKYLASFPPAISNYETIHTTKLPNGTYRFNISARGTGEVFLDDISILNTTNCSSGEIIKKIYRFGESSEKIDLLLSLIKE